MTKSEFDECVDSLYELIDDRLISDDTACVAISVLGKVVECFERSVSIGTRPDEFGGTGVSLGGSIGGCDVSVYVSPKFD